MAEPGAAAGRYGEREGQPRPHPDVVRLVAQFELQGVQPYERLGVLEARRVLEGVTRLQLPQLEVAQVRDVLVPGSAGLLPVRVYHPDPSRRLPLVIYLHGGGWVLGSVRAADRPCRRLALAGDCVVASLEYRRAPETKFPGPLEDCVSAVRWLAARAEEVGGDARQLVLLGDSAGGNLVAATTLCLREQGGPHVAAQVLIYPSLAPARGSAFASYREHGAGPLMTRDTMEWFWDQYLRSEGDGEDPRAAPLAEPNLSDLPPATVVVAELDPLRDEGLAYAARLRAADVRVTMTVYRGAAHGFWWMDGVLRQARELTEQLGQQLRAGRT